MYVGLFRCLFGDTYRFGVSIVGVLIVFGEYLPVEGLLPVGVANYVVELLRLEGLRVAAGLPKDVSNVVVNVLREWLDKRPSLWPLFPFPLLHANKIIIAITIATLIFIP